MNIKTELERLGLVFGPDEEPVVITRQSRIWAGGSLITPNIIFATNKRIIIRNPYLLGLKSILVDVPYEVMTSVKLLKGIFTSTILFEAPSLVAKSRFGLLKEGVEGDRSFAGIIPAIPKKTAEILLNIIRRGLRANPR